MAHFFVGQRVRVIAKDNSNCTCPLGAEGAIRSEGYELRLFDDAWYVQIGAAEYIVAKRDAGHILAPILRDDLRACDDDFKHDLDRLLERQGIAA